MTACQQIRYDGRTEWLAKRRTGIGASDIAPILGISPWTSTYQTWIDKVSDDAPEVEETEAMRWGKKTEDLILDEFEERTGLHVTGRQTMWRNLDRTWMLATTDGMVISDGESPMVVEAKQSSDWGWDEVPAHYLCQVQWQMMVVGAVKGFLAVLHRGNYFALHEIEVDLELQAEMIEAGAGFWVLVECQEPPPVSGDDNAFMAGLWPTSEEDAVEVDAELIEELRVAKALSAAAKSRQDAAEAVLKDVMKEADTAVVGDEIVATWKTQASRRLDTKRLKAEQPDTAAEYVIDRCDIAGCLVEGKHTHTRVLRPKEIKA